MAYSAILYWDLHEVCSPPLCKQGSTSFQQGSLGGVLEGFEQTFRDFLNILENSFEIKSIRRKNITITLNTSNSSTNVLFLIEVRCNRNF